jgi:hypothetical protein
MAGLQFVSPSDVVDSDVIGVFVADIPNGPTNAPLIICSGTVVFDFEGTDDGINKGVLQFFIPKEIDKVGGEPSTDPLNNPLDLSRFLQPGSRMHEATTVSLASITGDTGPWAVDGVEVILDGTKLQLTAGLAVGEGSHILRMAYQVNILITIQ